MTTKVRQLVIALGLTAPALGVAGTTDLQASFDRGFDNGPATVREVPRGEYDPYHHYVNVALYGDQRPATELQASFDRGFELGATTVREVPQGEFDPLQARLAIALATPEQNLVASFERGFDQGPASAYVTVTRGQLDPVEDAINTALRGTSNELLASFVRGFDRGAPSTQAVVTSEPDYLQALVQLALWSTDYRQAVVADVATQRAQKSL